MSSPLVSVVVPSYNHLTFLRQALASLYRQDFDGAYEVLVVNDASTDGTAEFLAAVEYPNLCVITHDHNLRLPQALNTGMRAAKGAFVTWVSADNEALPNFLSTHYQEMQKYPCCKFTHSAYESMNADGEHIQVERHKHMNFPDLLFKFCGCAAFMYDRRLHDIVGYYDPELEGAEDWDMWLKIMRHTMPRYIDKLTYRYRRHSNTMTEYMPDKIKKAVSQTMENAFQRHEPCFDIAQIYNIAHQPGDSQLQLYAAYVDFAGLIINSRHISAHHALVYLEKALALQPRSEEAHLLTLSAYLKLQDLDAAKKYFIKISKAKLIQGSCVKKFSAMLEKCEGTQRYT